MAPGKDPARLFASWARAFNANDLAAVEAMLADGFAWVERSTGRRYGAEAVLRRLRRAFAFHAEVRYEDPEVERDRATVERSTLEAPVDEPWEDSWQEDVAGGSVEALMRETDELRRALGLPERRYRARFSFAEDRLQEAAAEAVTGIGESSLRQMLDPVMTWARSRCPEVLEGLLETADPAEGFDDPGSALAWLRLAERWRRSAPRRAP